MKRSKIKQVGKIGRRNAKANRELKEKFGQTSIRSCEIRLDKCMGTFGLSFAHRHKRIWYRSRPELLSDMNQVVLACAYCHGVIEKDAEMTEKVFTKLRGEDNE